MLKNIILTACVICSSVLLHPADAPAMRPGEFIVLCYHSVPLSPRPDDAYSISREKFVEQIEYLRAHGYQPVAFQDILQAREGKKQLPEKAVLLTFDDAYISYYEFVVPFLEKLNYPSVLAVVGKFIDDPPPVGSPPDGLPEPLMNWEQIKELSSHSLVEVVSHSYDLHRGVQYNPQGNIAPAVSALAFDPDTGNYETEEEYRARIQADIAAQGKLFGEKLGFAPRVLVWPYGRFNRVSVEVARQNGIISTFTVKEGPSDIRNLDAVNRTLVENAPIEEFIKTLADPSASDTTIRAVQVDLDLIFDPDMDQMDKRLGRLIDRLEEMKVNTVYLQAFADPEGTGTIKSTYFHNRVLPVRADFFSHAVHQIMIRDMNVYAWMPALSFDLPEGQLNERLKVREINNGEVRISTSWYGRLTPFSKDTQEIVQTLYEDLASHAQIQGIVFQDDAYLTDKEDFSLQAVEQYKKRFGRDMIAADPEGSSGMIREWARYKTVVLIDYTKALMDAVKKYRPAARFARDLYAAVVEDPAAESWYAQNYELFLENYDQVVVMAYPQMEKVKRPSDWLKKLVLQAKRSPSGIKKTVFKLQAYDWQKEVWIADKNLLEEMRDVLSHGGRHIAYYPDDYWADKPAINTIKLEMSTRDYPFLP